MHRLSPREFQQLQEYASYSRKKLKDVVKEFDAGGVLEKWRYREPETEQHLSWDCFRKFIDVYFEADVPTTLTRHLFDFFANKPSAQPPPTAKRTSLAASSTHDCSEGDRPTSLLGATPLNEKLAGVQEKIGLQVAKMKPLVLHDLRKRSITSHKSESTGNIRDVSGRSSPASSRSSSKKSTISASTALAQQSERLSVSATAAAPASPKSVPLKEVVCYLSLLEGGSPEDKLEFMFRLYDTDSNGYLDSTEMESIIGQMMQVAAYLQWDTVELKPILQEMMREIDYDKDGTVSLEEWKRGGLTTIPLLVLLGLDSDTNARHHWVEGNCEGKCAKCRKNVKSFNIALTGRRCRWCHIILHSKCASDWKEDCDFGPLRYHILPPGSIYPLVYERQKNESSTTQRKESSRHMPSHPTSFQIVPPQFSRPLLVFINPKSGGRQGERIYAKFQYLLNPRQVYDLNAGGPENGLAMFSELGGNLNILCCGGDGTVGWVLESIDKIGFQSPPSVAILPLGTGNDLARCLNWGGGYEGTDSKDLVKILSQIEHATPMMLDRWHVNLQQDDPQEEGDQIPYSIINNYFSIGVDASIAIRFHTMREKHPEKFNSRTRNKLFYMEFGTTESLLSTYKNLQDYVDLICDGKPVDIASGPSLQSIAVLNIPSMYGGSNLWGAASGRRKKRASASRGGMDGGSMTETTDDDLIDLSQSLQDMGDRLIEVVGIDNAIHAAQIKAGTRSSGRRLAQCSHIVIKTKKRLPMQIDGEPWMQPPCRIEVGHKNQAVMLLAPSKKRRSLLGSVFRALRTKSQECEDVML